MSYIRSKIEDTAFQTWFDGLEISMIENETITLLVPNRFHYEWIESKYRHLIHDALKDVFGKSALALKNGKIGMTFSKGNTSLINLNKLNTNDN